MILDYDENGRLVMRTVDGYSPTDDADLRRLKALAGLYQELKDKKKRLYRMFD